jgi:hypothetical protein
MKQQNSRPVKHRRSAGALNFTHKRETSRGTAGGRFALEHSRSVLSFCSRSTCFKAGLARVIGQDIGYRWTIRASGSPVGTPRKGSTSATNGPKVEWAPLNPEAIGYGKTQRISSLRVSRQKLASVVCQKSCNVLPEDFSGQMPPDRLGYVYRRRFPGVRPRSISSCGVRTEFG